MQLSRNLFEELYRMILQLRLLAGMIRCRVLLTKARLIVLLATIQVQAITAVAIPEALTEVAATQEAVVPAETSNHEPYCSVYSSGRCSCGFREREVYERERLSDKSEIIRLNLKIARIAFENTILRDIIAAEMELKHGER